MMAQHQASRPAAAAASSSPAIRLDAVLAVDGARDALLLPGLLTPLELLRLRRVSRELRQYSNVALQVYPQLVLLGAHASARDSHADAQEEDEGGGEEDDSDEGGGGSNSEEERLFRRENRGNVKRGSLALCWSTGKWVAAPALPRSEEWPTLCAKGFPPEPPDAHRVCSVPARVGGPQWPPSSECAVLTRACIKFIDRYTLSGILPTRANGSVPPLERKTASGELWFMPTAMRGEGSVLVCSELYAEPGCSGAVIGRRLFLLGGYITADSEEEDDDAEDGHSATVEYLDLHTEAGAGAGAGAAGAAAAAGKEYSWTHLPPMTSRRTNFAAGYLPPSPAMATRLLKNCGYSPGKTLMDGLLIAAGGSDGVQHLRSAEVCVLARSGPEGSSCSSRGKWFKLPDMIQARGYCTGCATPDGRFVVIGGREFGDHRDRLPSPILTHRDGEIFDTVAWKWRALPSLPVLFGQSAVTVCAAGPDLLVAAMSEP